MRYFYPILLFSLWLTGCVSQPARPDFEHLHVSDIEQWEIQGKFSIQQPHQALSASLNWRQYAIDRYEIGLSGPLGQGSVLLSGYPDKVIFRDAHGDTEVAYNAELLLYHHTGWSLPIESLYYWTRGLPDPNYKYQYILNPQGDFAKLKQHGWTIVYNTYQEQDGYTVPRKITLNYPETRITLLLRTWQINPTD